MCLCVSTCLMYMGIHGAQKRLSNVLAGVIGGWKQPTRIMNAENCTWSSAGAAKSLNRWPISVPHWPPPKKREFQKWHVMDPTACKQVSNLRNGYNCWKKSVLLQGISTHGKEHQGRMADLKEKQRRQPVWHYNPIGRQEIWLRKC